MKNSVSVVLYMPYEDLEFDGLRKALEFAIESKEKLMFSSTENLSGKATTAVRKSKPPCLML